MFERQRDLFSDGPLKPMTWREKYNAVIQSKRWRKLRERFLEAHDSRCMKCGWQKARWDKSRQLELHHVTYERLGAERDEDLQLLCTVCHWKADRQRAAEGKQRSADALYDAQFHGWAAKVYGDDYFEHEDYEMHDQFLEWLERTEYHG